MKTYEEMAQNALDRISDYETNQKKRRKTFTKIMIPAVSFCLAAVLGIGTWQFGWFRVKPEISSSDVAYNTSAKDDVTADNSNKGENETTQDTCYFWWKNKLNMGGQLYNAIENDKNGTFSVVAAYRPATAEITSFTYEGKTLSELAIEAEEEGALPDKMRELLKLGDELKYGTALYETGTPSGEKWDKGLYEEKVVYFGEKLLNKYIVNGEFLRDKLLKDIAEYNEDSANRKYKLAYNAYLETVLPSAVKLMNENNIQCERKKHSNNCITFIATAKELENLPLKELKNWYFELESNNQKGTSDKFDSRQSNRPPR